MIHIEAGATDTGKPCVLLENHFATGTLAASTEATDYDVENAVAENTYDGWQPTAMPAEMSVVLGASDAADCVAIAAHNLGSKGATVIVEYMDGSWTEAASFTPTDDSTILILFPEQSSDEWRIRLTGSDEPTINFIMLGKRLVFPSGIVGDYTPTDWGARIDVLGGQSRSGQFLGQRIVRRGADTRVDVGRVPLSWYLADGLPFPQHYNEGRLFFYAGWPANLSNDLALCWRDERGGEIRPVISASDWVSLSFNVSCYVAA